MGFIHVAQQTVRRAGCCENDNALYNAGNSLTRLATIRFRRKILLENVHLSVLEKITVRSAATIAHFQSEIYMAKHTCGLVLEEAATTTLRWGQQCQVSNLNDGTVLVITATSQSELNRFRTLTRRSVSVTTVCIWPKAKCTQNISPTWLMRYIQLSSSTCKCAVPVRSLHSGGDSVNYKTVAVLCPTLWIHSSTPAHSSPVSFIIKISFTSKIKFLDAKTCMPAVTNKLSAIRW